MDTEFDWTEHASKGGDPLYGIVVDGKRRDLVISDTWFQANCAGKEFEAIRSEVESVALGVLADKPNDDPVLISDATTTRKIP